MATTDLTAKVFPGAYVSITDQSYLTPQTSRFNPGLVGVATKGPMDTPTPVVSLADFIRKFGQPLPGDFWLANAVAMLSDMTDGMKVVRVGKKATQLVNATFISSAPFTSTGTIVPSGKALVLDGGVQTGGVSSPVVYASITQIGKTSTINATVLQVGTNTQSVFTDAGTATLAGNVIQDTYTGGAITYSVGAPAANAAETILYAYTYGTAAGSPGNYGDAGLYSGSYQLTATGNKGAYQFTLSPASAWQKLPAGTLLKINQSGKATTHEVRVKQALPDGTVYLETTNRLDIGYQALPLQDTYTNAYIYAATGYVPFLFLQASSAGEWANSGGLTSGLFVKVRPGGPQGTKKFEMWENGALQETIDGLYNGSGTNSYVGSINGFSQEIVVTCVAGDPSLPSDIQPANYSLGYQTSPLATGLGPVVSPPNYLINSGVSDSGANFYFGFNGEGAAATDFIGAYDPAADQFTGIQSFVDTDNVEIDVLACPGVTDAQVNGGNDVFPWDQQSEPFSDTDTTGVHAMMVQVARQINSVALIDIPPGLTARQAIDWHNGQGLYSGRGRIDSYNAAVYWNWFTVTDPFTAQTKWMPPTIGALRCLAYTFDRDKPWYAAAGNTRGLIPEAKSVENERVSDDVMQSMYGVGTGQSVNGIFLMDGQIKLWGERTMQVAESKLSVVHNVILVNYVLSNLGQLAKQFVFEPNDAELITQVNLAFSQFLDTVKTERGVEDYNLVIDNTNNTPDTRNLRELIVNLALVPIDTVERIYIYATVNSSGANLKNATAD